MSTFTKQVGKFLNYFLAQMYPHCHLELFLNWWKLFSYIFTILLKKYPKDKYFSEDKKKK